MISQLDQDFYTYTVGQAVWQNRLNNKVVYRFFDRQKRIKYDDVAESLQEYINHMATVKYEDEELTYLKQYLDEDYVYEFLDPYYFDPSEVQLYNDEGYLGIKIKGDWARTIFWEVPLLSAVSEIFYKSAGSEYRSWSEEQWHAASKLQALKLIGKPFVEAGTRRRRSFNVQDAVLYGLFSHDSKMLGTSNVYFAKKYGYTPIGTMSHQWPMAFVGMRGLRDGMDQAKMIWQNTYKDNPGFFLTDTFTTPHFLQNLTPYEARHFDGFRQDSGDPLEICRMICDRYREMGIAPRRKQIVFSDNLTVDRVREICLQMRVEQMDIDPTFMIGTHFTNDYSDRALNIVIKMTKILDGDKWKNCVKISDDITKATGSKKKCKTLLQQINPSLANA